LSNPSKSLFDLDARISAYAAFKDQEESHREGVSSLEQLIKKRLNTDHDARITVTGQSGSGKSTLALVIAEKVDPSTFIDHAEEAAETHVIFSAREFLTAQRKLPEKSVLIQDESGQSAHHRMWMSSANVATSLTYIGNRFRLFCMIECVPSLSLQDVDTIRQSHYLCHILSRGTAKVYQILQPRLTGAVWYDGLIDELAFAKPNAKLWAAYMKRKVQAQNELAERLEGELEAVDKPKVGRKQMVSAIRSDLAAFQDAKGNLDTAKIVKRFDCGVNTAGIVRRLVEED